MNTEQMFEKFKQSRKKQVAYAIAIETLRKQWYAEQDLLMELTPALIREGVQVTLDIEAP